MSQSSADPSVDPGSLPLDQKVGTLDAKVGNLVGEVRVLGKRIDRIQAQVMELLTHLIGRHPNAG